MPQRITVFTLNLPSNIKMCLLHQKGKALLLESSTAAYLGLPCISHPIVGSGHTLNSVLTQVLKGDQVLLGN